MLRDLVVLAVFVVASYTVITLFRIIVGARQRSGALGSNSAGLEDRVARLEHTIEGLAAENQRLVDGQRFFTQLLAQRPGVPAIAGPSAADGKDGSNSRR